jgi:hypothetical protein
MLLRPWPPFLFGLILLSACRGGDEPSHDRERARLDAVEQRLGTLEQRLAAIDKDLPTGERLRNDLHALEQRVGAVESKATEALETAKSARGTGAPAPSAPPPAAPRRRGDVTPAPTRLAPAERRAQLAALMTEYSRRLADVRRQESPGAGPADQMAARRAVRDWYIARRRAIIAGQPLPD